MKSTSPPPPPHREKRPSHSFYLSLYSTVSPNVPPVEFSWKNAGSNSLVVETTSSRFTYVFLLHTRSGKNIVTESGGWDRSIQQQDLLCLSWKLKVSFVLGFSSYSSSYSAWLLVAEFKELSHMWATLISPFHGELKVKILILSRPFFPNSTPTKFSHQPDSHLKRDLFYLNLPYPKEKRPLIFKHPTSRLKTPARKKVTELLFFSVQRKKNEDLITIWQEAKKKSLVQPPVNLSIWWF